MLYRNDDMNDGTYNNVSLTINTRKVNKTLEQGYL